MKALMWGLVLLSFAVFIAEANCVRPVPEIYEISLAELIRLLVLVLLGTSISAAMADVNDASKSRRTIGLQTVEKAIEAMEDFYAACPRVAGAALTKAENDAIALGFVRLQATMGRVDLFLQDSDGTAPCKQWQANATTHVDNLNELVMDHLRMRNYKFNIVEVNKIRAEKSSFDSDMLMLRLAMVQLRTPSWVSRKWRAWSDWFYPK